MTEQSNADLIAEAKSRAELCDADTREAMRDTGNIVARLADALEAAEQRVSGLAAVIEEAEDHLTRHFLDMRVADEVLPILASAPADALEAADDEGDTGWEYGVHLGASDEVRAHPTRGAAIADARAVSTIIHPDGGVEIFERTLMRRKAGPWEPVEGETGD